MSDVHVLVCAPSAFHLALMADLLAANGIATRRASDEPEALKAVAAECPTLILWDLELGAPPTEKLKATAATPPGEELAIVALGGSGEGSAAAELLQRGVHAALQKPIDTAAFSRTVVREVRRRTTREGRSAMI